LAINSRLAIVEEPALEKAASSSSKSIFVVGTPMLRSTLNRIINREWDLDLCGEESEADRALKEIARLKPGLVIVDLELNGKSGPALIPRLRRLDPELKILAASAHDGACCADRALQAGADGYIWKQEADSEELIEAIRDVLGGYIYVSEEVVEGRAWLA
jgi:DNA-binding NarL/FixJ family response regulator